MTQKAFADLLGVHVKSIQNYVAGNTFPGVDVVEAICQQTGVSPDWIVLGQGEMIGSGKTPPMPEELRRLEEVAGQLIRARVDRLNALAYLLLEFQRNDRREEAFEQGMEAGSAAVEKLQAFTSVLRQSEAIEWEAIAAFSAAMAKSVREGREVREGAPQPEAPQSRTGQKEGKTGKRPKRGRGRPRGSKNRTKYLQPLSVLETYAQGSQAKKSAGQAPALDENVRALLEEFGALWAKADEPDKL